MKMTTIKDTLVKAGRYTDVMSVLHEALDVKGPNCPVVCHNDGTGRVCYDVYPAEVKAGAQKIIDLIDSNVASFPFSDDLDSIYWYIRTECERSMHNYCVTLSHRQLPKDYKLEKIRIYCIIQNMIEANDVDDTDWTIPSGWKSLKEIDDE